MTTDKIHLAVWRDCEACVNSDGKLHGGKDCWKCKGLGKCPTFIPLDRLLDSGVALPSLCAVRDWMREVDRDMDQLTAELDASGLVPDMPGPGREGYANDRDHLTVSGTFQSDKYKWCPSGFVPLKLTDPAARDLLAIYAVRRKPIDAEFSQDLIEALANVPEKPNDKYEAFQPLQVETTKPSQEKCHRCGGTGRRLFWNGTQPCGGCNGTGVQPVKEGAQDA